MRFQLRTLRTNRGIDVPHTVAFRANQFHCLAQQDFTVDVTKLLSRIRKMITDISHIGCPEKGIADGMNQDIGIAMPQQPHGMLQTYTPQP